jgi:hypothetical protein
MSEKKTIRINGAMVKLCAMEQAMAEETVDIALQAINAGLTEQVCSRCPPALRCVCVVHVCTCAYMHVCAQLRVCVPCCGRVRVITSSLRSLSLSLSPRMRVVCVRAGVHMCIGAYGVLVCLCACVCVCAFVCACAFCVGVLCVDVCCGQCASVSAVF